MRIYLTDPSIKTRTQVLELGWWDWSLPFLCIHMSLWGGDGDDYEEDKNHVVYPLNIPSQTQKLLDTFSVSSNLEILLKFTLVLFIRDFSWQSQEHGQDEDMPQYN